MAEEVSATAAARALAEEEGVPDFTADDLDEDVEDISW